VNNIEVTCLEITNLTMGQIEMLSPEALKDLSKADRKALKKREQLLKSNSSEPTVDPNIFAMSVENTEITSHLEALAQQKVFLENERAKLKTIQGGMQQLILENVAASKDLMQDTESQVVTVMGGLFSMMKLPPEVSTGIATALPACQFYFLHRAYSTTDDATRAHDKMVESVGQLKNIIAANPLVFSTAEGDTVKAGMDVVLKVYKITERRTDPQLTPSTRADMEDVNSILQDMIQVANATAGRALNAGTGYPNMIVASYAMGRLEENRNQLQNALDQNSKALDYFDERIAQVEKDEAFYKERKTHVRHQN